MEIERKVFLEAINKVSLGGKLIDDESPVVFRDGKLVMLYDDVAVRVDFEVDFEVALPSRPLIALLKRLDLGVVKTEKKETGLLIKAGRKRSEIRELAVTIPWEDQRVDWHPLPDDFEEQVKIVADCAGSDSSRYMFTCVHVCKDRLEASTGFHVGRFDVPIPIEEECLVYADSLLAAAKCGIKEIGETDSCLCFRGDGFECIIGKIDGTFPTTDHLFEDGGSAIQWPDEIGEMIGCASIFTVTEKFDDISVSFLPGKMRLHGQGIDGWFEERLKCNYEGDKIDFMIRPSLLSRLAKRSKECIAQDGRILVADGDFRFVTVTTVGEK